MYYFEKILDFERENTFLNTFDIPIRVYFLDRAS